jgi:MFS family permease
MPTMRGDVKLFVQLFVSIGVAIANGCIFTFALLTPTLHGPAFRFTAQDITVVSTVGVVASYCSLPTGYIFDRWGPRVTLLVGAGVNFTGWIVLYLIFTGRLSRSVPSVAAAYGVSQLAASFYETGTVLANLAAFSLHQGRVVMIQKTFMGLGSSVVVMVYNGFFVDADIAAFCLFVALFGGAIGVLGAALVRLPHGDRKVEGLNFNVRAAARYDAPFRIGIALLAWNIAFIFAVNIWESVDPAVSPSARQAVACVSIASCLAFAAMVAAVPRQTSRSSSVESSESGGQHEELLDEETRASGRTSCGTAESRPLFTQASDLVAKNGRHLSDNIKKVDMWLLWLVCFCTWGAMAMVNSNSELIYRAIAGDDFTKVRNAVNVSIFGIASALGRVAVGAALPHLQARGHEVWRLTPAGPALMVLALPLFLALPAAAVAVCFFLVGLATGVAWGTIVLVITRLFSRPGMHYNFLYTAGMLTPFAFNLGLFSPVFEAESNRQGQEDHSDCRGTGCIDVSIVVATVLNVFATAIAVVFARRQDGGALMEDDGAALDEPAEVIM